jgi:hypothetical protein
MRRDDRRTAILEGMEHVDTHDSVTCRVREQVRSRRARRAAPARRRAEGLAVPPLDPRDPEIVRAKELGRRGPAR